MSPIFFAAIAVLAWIKWTGRPWREFGFVRPRSWVPAFAIGIPFGIVFKLGMKALVMPVLGANPVNETYRYLAGNPGGLALMLFTVIVSGGFAEETFFRGFLFERIGKLTGHSRWSKPVAVVVTTALFASLHYFDQGRDGVVQAIFTGLTFGTIFAATGEIWMVMVIHAVFDITALALIYWDLEPVVAHFVFKR